MQPPIHEVLRCEDEAVGIVMRKYRVEQAARPVVDRAEIKTQAKGPHLLIPKHLRVKRVDMSQAEDDSGDDSSVRYYKSPHLPNTGPRSRQEGVDQPAKKDLLRESNKYPRKGKPPSNVHRRHWIAERRGLVREQGRDNVDP